MHFKTPTGKASKGSVVIISSNNRLQLRFNFGGKRRYLSMGLPDIPVNRRLAELKAAEIEKDILYERFDTTLQKYKSISHQNTITPITPTKISELELDELWEKYSEFKKLQDHSLVELGF